MMLNPDHLLNLIMWALGLHLTFDAFIAVQIWKLDRKLLRVELLIPKRHADHTEE